MQLRTFKLRFRRRFRLRKRQVARLSLEAEDQLEERFFKRLGRLRQVRRFMALWIILLLVLGAGIITQIEALSGYFQTLQYIPGGTFNEGVVGNYTNANPIYATTTADTTVSHLVFGSLLKYDDNGQLIGDLASSWSVNDHGNVYTVKLRPHLSWQDGKPLTASDVVFTFQLIQNPDANSPLITSWQNIKVAAVDSQTVTFTLPGTLSSFPYSLTTGIVPEHLLRSIAPANLRSNPFNTANPVGAGPFAFRALQVSGDTPQTHQEQIALAPFAQYYGGQPKLDQFTVHVYQDEGQMVHSYQAQGLDAIAGVDDAPAAALKNSQVRSITTLAANMVFFKTTSGVLADKAVRQALVAASNPQQIISQLGYNPPAVTEPLLQNQLGYNAAYQQATNDAAQAASKLDAAGWAIGKNGLRAKDGTALGFSLYAQDTPENRSVTSQLQKQWHAIGVSLRVVLQSANDLQDTITFHNYDALLYGITIGADPDVFAYWDSSQADVRSANRLNFSEYKSTVADAALEAGRARTDPAVRVVKYRSFLQA